MRPIKTVTKQARRRDSGSETRQGPRRKGPRGADFYWGAGRGQRLRAPPTPGASARVRVRALAWSRVRLHLRVKAMAHSSFIKP